MKNILVGLVVLLGLCGVAPSAFSQAAESSQSAQGTAPAEAGGKRVREFQGDDLGQVLRLLARQAKINLAVGEAVKGTVNVRLENVSALDAIEVLVRQFHLLMTKDDKGVSYINLPETTDATLDLLAKPETAERVATFIGNLRESLTKKGFSPNEALEIVKSIGPGLVLANPEKKPDPAPAR